MLWRPFFARVEVNHRSIYSRILAKACAVAVRTGLVKEGLKNGLCLFKKHPFVRYFSSLAQYELTLNSFCQHCSNKILT